MLVKWPLACKLRFMYVVMMGIGAEYSTVLLNLVFWDDVKIVLRVQHPRVMSYCGGYSRTVAVDDHGPKKRYRY